MDTKKEVEIKLWAFIIRPNALTIQSPVQQPLNPILNNVPEQVGLTLAFDEAEAIKAQVKKYAREPIPVSIKSTGYFTLEQIKEHLGKLFEREEEQPAETPEFAKALEVEVLEVNETSKIDFAINNLKFILEDATMQEIR